MKIFRKNSKGFTLIELLVVIAIIGILSSVVLASLNSARRKGRDARRVEDIGQLRLALELYYDANRSYPTALTAALLVTPGYIPVIPTDPVSGAVYAYSGSPSGCAAGACTSYHLGAALEEKATSGETGGNLSLVSDSDTQVGALWHGHSADCVATVSAANDGCYDMVP